MCKDTKKMAGLQDFPEKKYDFLPLLTLCLAKQNLGCAGSGKVRRKRIHNPKLADTQSVPNGRAFRLDSPVNKH
jgi:hypothetical protein